MAKKKKAQATEPTREELSEFAYQPTSAEGLDEGKAVWLAVIRAHEGIAYATREPFAVCAQHIGSENGSKTRTCLWL